MRKLIMLLGLSLLAAPAGVVAQGPDAPPCGDLENKQRDLESYARYFTQEDLAPVREAVGIERLPSDAPRRVVDEKKECGRVFGKLMSRLAEVGELQRLRENGFDFSIFRFGPFYATLVVEKPQDDPPQELSTGYGQLLIFRASDLAYVGGIAD